MVENDAKCCKLFQNILDGSKMFQMFQNVPNWCNMSLNDRSDPNCVKLLKIILAPLSLFQNVPNVANLCKLFKNVAKW